MANSDYPVSTPLITDVLARAIHREMLEGGKKPTAYPTFFRHSDAGKCSRYLFYEWSKAEPSNPPDVSSAWVMWIGTMLHAELQRALPERFPDCKIEVPVHHGDLTSGHLDALIVLPDSTRICYELKTRGSFGFDKAVGWRRKDWHLSIPEGPTSSDRIQGALNATASDADLLIIGMMGMESASKGFADKNGIGDIGRTTAEWHFKKSEFAPWAAMEMDRLEQVRDVLLAEAVPARTAVGDEMEAITLNPKLASPSWQCQYCSHLSTCRRDP